MHGPLAVAHNGNLVNAGALREELLAKGFGLTATSDTEVLTLMLAAAGGKTWEDRIERTLPAWKGAYSLVLVVNDRVIAVRDPWGFRPMSVGRLPHGGYAVASETCALNTLGCIEIDEVQPGEIVTLQGAELTRRQALTPSATPARCTFEFVYFSRPDSVWAGRNVHHVRQRLGEQLAIESGVDADVVIPVPDSSIPAAIGYSRAAGIEHNDGLIKNRYIGRTFIEPTQDLRERGVALKFNALSENLAGKRVVMIDDSLVRGTTAGPLVKLLRDAGATEVHVRITCPPITRVSLRRRHGPRRRPDGGTTHRGRDARPHRRRLAGLPLAGGDDAGDRAGERRQRAGLLQRVLHGALPDAGRRSAAQAQLRRRAVVTPIAAAASGRYSSHTPLWAAFVSEPETTSARNQHAGVHRGAL